MVHFYDVTMRAVISGVNVVDGLLRLGVCLLTVLVVLCAVDRSSSRDATTRRTNVTLSSRHPNNLTSQQRNSSVTIVFRNIDTKNRTAVDFACREVRRKILDCVNRKRSTAASTSWTTATPSRPTSIVSTATVTTSSTPGITTASTTPKTTAAALTASPTTRAIEDTTQTPTTVATPAMTTQSPVTTITTDAPTPIEPTVPVGRRKRRRRDSEESKCLITEEDIIFVENEDETDENGNLSISVSIDKEECKYTDLFDVISNEFQNKIDDGLETIALVEIFRGLPLASNATGMSHLLSFRHSRNLTPGQRNSAVTIAFNFNHIDQKNRLALVATYREVRMTFLDYLNHIKTTATSTTLSTSTGPNSPFVIVVYVEAAARTTATTTPAVIKSTPKTSLLETQTLHAPDDWNRKRRNSGRRNDTYTENDLHFIRIEPKVDEDGILRMALFIDNERFSDLNLYDVAIALKNSGELEAAAKAPVVAIYRGLPVATLHLRFQLWLPILVVAICLLPIFIFVCYWRTRNKKSIATREINASAGELTTERMDRLRESRRQQPTDTFQQEICAISSYVEETNTLLFNTRSAGRMWPAS